MKIAIVNDIHVGKPLEHNGKVRASSHLMEGVLKNFYKTSNDSTPQMHSLISAISFAVKAKNWIFKHIDVFLGVLSKLAHPLYTF